MTEMVKDGYREWGVEELRIEIATSANVTSIGGEDSRVVNLRRRLDERYATVEWQEVAPPVEV